MDTAADIAQRTLVINRTLQAPRHVVFDVWTRPEHLVRWWGPKDFTLPVCEQDLRPGGNYRFCMRAPDGSDHWVHGTYVTIDRPERLVFTWLRTDDAGAVWCETEVSITLRETGASTELTLHQGLFATADHCSEHRGGWDECMDRLATYVAEQATTH
ncbi:MAG TPA: SRPBCC domain-containing protein [Flavobacteriales bacterium]|jgi:uncharacterized protein YndB with AHSA1/START domain|nr:SRPBCC domain-containing protein [Flavobacteriales bacterium]